MHLTLKKVDTCTTKEFEKKIFDWIFIYPIMYIVQWQLWFSQLYRLYLIQEIRWDEIPKVAVSLSQFMSQVTSLMKKQRHLWTFLFYVSFFQLFSTCDFFCCCYCSFAFCKPVDFIFSQFKLKVVKIRRRRIGTFSSTSP